MAELTGQTSTIQPDTESSLMPQKRRGAALDRGFPTLVVLSGLVFLIFLLQGIALRKVLHLDQEIGQKRAEVARDRALLNKDISDHEDLRRQLPGLKNEVSELEARLPSLQGEVATLEKRRSSLQGELPGLEKRYQELKAASEQSEATRSALDREVGALKGEINNKTAELGQLKQDIENLRTQQKFVETRKNDLDKEVKRLDTEVYASFFSLNSRLNFTAFSIRKNLGPVHHSA